MADRIVMGYWDCPVCGSKGIKGLVHDCPNCGRQRGKETRFYMKEGTVEYVPGHKVEGSDWYCEYCGALNPATYKECENCGSSKLESKKDYFSLQKQKVPAAPAKSASSSIELSSDTAAFVGVSIFIVIATVIWFAIATAIDIIVAQRELLGN